MKIIVAFYASNYHASEYRSGAEFISFAASVGFNLAVVADLEQNDSIDDLMAANPGISVVKLPSPVRKQSLLYSYTDFIPQVLWHYRVATWLSTRYNDIEVLWLQNGAQPWLPLGPYLRISRKIIWGPLGGGNIPPRPLLRHLGPISCMREWVRNLVERLALNRKRSLLQRGGAPKILPIARTVEARASLQRLFPCQPVPVIPEILRPLRGAVIARVPCDTPRFVWVGQDIPRKNLPLALEMFGRLKAEAFPGATLDVFGVKAGRQTVPSGVTYHGWVRRIDWPCFRNQGVLLLTSFREGLPSAVLEAISNGLLCVTSEVGAIPTLNQGTVFLLPRSEYPNYSAETYTQVIAAIKRHLSSHKVVLSTINSEEPLRSYLEANKVI